MPKKSRLTENEKLIRRATRKAAAENAKLINDVGPLFVAQIPQNEFQTPADQYWKYRRTYAMEGGRGEAAGYLHSIDQKVDVYIIRRLAQRFMTAKDYAIAVEASEKYGTVLDFWKNILLGRRRIVLSYWRHVYGCTLSQPNAHWDGPPCFVEKRIECGELLVWPPADFQAPLTSEQLNSHLALPHAELFPGAVDPLGLANKP